MVIEPKSLGKVINQSINSGWKWTSVGTLVSPHYWLIEASCFWSRSFLQCIVSFVMTVSASCCILDPMLSDAALLPQKSKWQAGGTKRLRTVGKFPKALIWLFSFLSVRRIFYKPVPQAVRQHDIDNSQPISPSQFSKHCISCPRMYRCGRCSPSIQVHL